MSKLISASEASRRLGVTDKTVRSWVKQGKLHAIHIQKNLLGIPEQDVEQLARERRLFTSTPSHPDISEHIARLEHMEQELSEVSERYRVLDLHIASLDLELMKFRGRLEQLEQRLERAEKAEITTMKEKAVASPVKQDSDQQQRVSAPSGGTIASHTFADLHSINKRTMSDYLAGERFNDRMESEVIGRSGSKLVRGLTPIQQHQAILFFERHNVRYTSCPQCPHEQEQEKEQEQ